MLYVVKAPTSDKETGYFHSIYSDGMTKSTWGFHKCPLPYVVGLKSAAGRGKGSILVSFWGETGEIIIIQDIPPNSRYTSHSVLRTEKNQGHQ